MLRKQSMTRYGVKDENSVINLLEFISASKLKTVCNAFIPSQANHETIPPSKKRSVVSMSQINAEKWFA